MFHGFNRIARSKVYIAAILCTSIGGIVVALFVLINQLKQSYQASTTIEEVLNKIGEARRAEKDFLLKDFNSEVFIRTGKSAFFDKNQQILQESDSLIRILQANSVCQSEENKLALTTLQQDLARYNTAFETIGKLYRERGFNDMGLEGQMRVAVYFVEEANFPTDKTDLLLLRREEKDFFLRKDKHYVKTFAYQLNKFQNKIDSIIAGGKSPEIGDHVKAALETYGVVFFKIVEIEKRVGLDENEGLRKEMNLVYQKIQSAITTLNTDLNQYAHTAISWILGILIVLIVLFIIGLAVSNYLFKRLVVTPIQELTTITLHIADGDIDTSLAISLHHNSLNNLLAGFGKVIHRLQQTTLHLTEISEGKLDTEIEVASSKDKLNHSLLHLTSQLRLLKAEETRQNWINIGYARIAEILQRNAEIAVISHEVLKELLHYVKACQGAVFVELPNTDILEMKACIAFDKKKYIQKQIDKSFGLVGQCWKEGDYIYMKQVPEDYPSITSGLGDATPRSILLVPLIANNTKEGVLELASFQYFEPHEIQFLEKVGQSIASTFAHLKMVEALHKQKNYASL